jgi:hypothetical protein
MDNGLSLHKANFQEKSTGIWECGFFVHFEGGNTQALLARIILICKNGRTVWLHHYPISNFGEYEILDVCFFILTLIHIECGNSILMHLIIRKLLGFVVFLDVLWPYLLVETIDLNSLVVGHTWFLWSKENSIWWLICDQCTLIQ